VSRLDIYLYRGLSHLFVSYLNSSLPGNEHSMYADHKASFKDGSAEHGEEQLNMLEHGFTDTAATT